MNVNGTIKASETHDSTLMEGGDIDQSNIVLSHREVLKARQMAPTTTKVLDIIYSFNCWNAFTHLSKTRAKPWDNRELDSLEGMKFLSFVFTAIS